MISFALDSSIERFNVDSFFDVTSSWTKLFYMKQGNTTPGADNRNYWTFGDDVSYTDPYIYVGSDSGSNNLFLELWDGTTLTDTTKIIPVAGQKKYVAVTYNSSTHVLSFYHDNTLIGTITKDLSTVVFVGKDEDINNAFGDCSVGYFRDYQRCLSLTEITAESASITPVSSTNLLTTSPLQSPVDLTDHNGTINCWTTLTGTTISTDTDDPLISVVVGPPTNTTPSTALDVNLDSAKFVDTLSGGSAVLRTWYKYTAQAGDRWLGSIGFGDLVTFKPRMFVYEGLANANSLTPYKNLSPANNGALQFAVTAGNTYYWSADRNGAVTPATVIVSIIKGPNLTVPVGAIAINDDISNEYPAVFVSTVTNNIVYNFAEIVAGEQADVLPTSGFSLVADQIDNVGDFIYNGSFQSVTSITTIDGIKSRIRTCNTPERWYVGLNNNPPTARTVDQNGTIGSSVSLTGSTSLAALAASNDETILYLVESGANKAIKTWDLVNNVAGANLAAGIVNYVATDILYLANDKIAVMYYKSSVTRDALLKIYSTAGATLISQSLGIPNGSTGPRMCYAINDPTSIWVYIHITGEQSLLLNVTTATGATASTRTVPTFESSASVTPTTNAPPRFGASFSCPIWVVRVASLAPASTASGLYKLTGTNINNPRITHDTIWLNAQAGTTEERAIPNPFAESYLAGDE